MKLNRIADMAKRAIDKRGGMEALKGDLQEVQEIAKGRGSLREKAKAAAAAVRSPGRAPASPSADPAAERGTPPASSSADPAAERGTPPPPPGA